MGDIRYYTDENVAVAVASGLRLRNVGVLTAGEADRLGYSDEAQLAFARDQGRVIFTQDNDFLRIAAKGETHVGIVYAHQQTSIGDVIRGLVLIYHVLSAKEIIGNIEFL